MWWKSIVLCIFQITLVSRRAFSDREDDSVSPDLIKYVAVIKEKQHTKESLILMLRVHISGITKGHTVVTLSLHHDTANSMYFTMSCQN